jgi:hypothetical protein
MLAHRSITNAAKSLGVYYTTLEKWYTHYFGNMPRCDLRKPSKDDLAKDIKEIGASRLAKKLGVSTKVLRRWADEYELILGGSSRLKPDGFYTLTEAAKLMGVTKMALSVRFRKGTLPGAFRVNKKTVLIPAAVVGNAEKLYERHEKGTHYGKPWVWHKLKDANEQSATTSS